MRIFNAKQLRLLGLCLTLSLFFTGAALAQVGTDVVGIYFDTIYTQNSFDVAITPSLVTGYLVMHNPSATAGVGGWELCAEIDGPAQFTNWTLEGQTINTSPTPCFTVGIGGPPLPAGENVLLATFQMVVEDKLPVTISLVPKFNPSLPNQMSYLDGADLGSILPMSTVSGNSEVAFINEDVPWYEVTPQTLAFWDVNIGQSQTKSVSVTNVGGGLLQLDIGLAGDCTGFALPGISGPVSLGPGQTTQVQVRFTPETEDLINCSLVLGGIVPNVALAGTGHTPIISWTVTPSALDFGLVPIETQKTMSVTVYNSGEAAITIEPAVEDTSGSFTLATAESAHILQPNGSIVIGVSFLPAAVGDFTGMLNLGTTVDPVPLTGEGFEGTLAWSAPISVDFGIVSVGTNASTNVVISNVGTSPFSVAPSLINPDGVFVITSSTEPVSLLPGQYHIITVKFAPLDDVTYSAFLDLGSPVGLISLSGTGTLDLVSGTYPSTVDFGPVAVASTSSRVVPVTNNGSVDFTITPTMIIGETAFNIISGGGSTTLQPGDTHNIEVGFSPTAIQSYFELIDLGGPLGTVVLLGSGSQSSLAWIAPTAVDFGTVAMGTISEKTIGIENVGTENFTLDVAIPSPADFYLVSGGGNHELSPGTSHEIVIGFLPQSEGPLTGTLELGATVPAVALQGAGRQPVTSFVVAPESLELGSIAVGYPITGIVALVNTGDTVLEINPTLVGSDPGFTLISGGGVSQVQPGTTTQVKVQFEAAMTGPFAMTLVFGGIIPDVPITANAEEPSPGCAVSPQELVFGSVNIGWLETRYITIINDGNIPLYGTPSLASCQYFSVDTTPLNIAPGQQVILPVQFNPLAEGSWTCTFDLGIGECSSVLCSGSGVPSGVPGSMNNTAMVFFDQDFGDNNIETQFDNQIITGYLVLLYPSETAGVGGWEGCLDLDGDAQFVDFTLEGQTINVETPPCFLVGIGGSPLPYSQNILLASFQCLVASPLSEVDVLLGPTREPSIAGYSAWIPWDNLSNLIPMQPWPGQVLVGQINSPRVGVEAPTPQAAVTSGGVTLSWVLADLPAESCHVYRRLEGADEERLTTTPIVPQGNTFTFTDSATGVAPGSQLSYSYAILRGGLEQARSPEVTVTLGGLPSTLTRLLPNVPNPFNPQTEVRFELADAGHIRITIYDVTGRKVATLLDENRGPGPHSLTWQGRDDAGRPLPSGAYYLRLESEGRISHRKMLLLK